MLPAQRNWRDALRNLGDFLEGGSFRHDLSTIPVWAIAEQFYCEKKVELEMTKGAVPTEAKNRGKTLHEELLAMEKATLEEFIKAVESPKLSLASFRLAAEVANLRVMGKPDLVIFRKEKPLWLIDLKTTMGPLSQLYIDQVVQVQTYGLLLQFMGFDCSKLDLCIVKMKRDLLLLEDQREAFLSKVAEPLMEERIQEFERASKGTLRILQIDFDSEDALKNVTWARDYWLGLREAVPTKKPGKCRACEYSPECNSRLA